MILRQTKTPPLREGIRGEAGILPFPSPEEQRQRARARMGADHGADAGDQVRFPAVFFLQDLRQQLRILQAVAVGDADLLFV